MDSLRIDRLLCYLRFVRTRSRAAALVDGGHIRCDGQRVTRHSHPVGAGATLTLPIGETVRVVRIDSLPDRRGSAAQAQGHYTVLDPRGQSDLAALETGHGGPDCANEDHRP